MRQPVEFNSNDPRIGFLPYFWNEKDKASPFEQANKNYSHGGGWMPFSGFTLSCNDADGFVLDYPDDPPLLEIGRADFKGTHWIVAFPHSWVMIVEQDDMSTFEVSRMD